MLTNKLHGMHWTQMINSYTGDKWSHTSSLTSTGSDPHHSYQMVSAQTTPFQTSYGHTTSHNQLLVKDMIPLHSMTETTNNMVGSDTAHMRTANMKTVVTFTMKPHLLLLLATNTAPIPTTSYSMLHMMHSKMDTQKPH